MQTITQKEYKDMISRQSKIEAAIDALSKVVASEIDDSRIKLTVLKRWDRISKDLDNGRGRFFSSAGEAKKWLRSL